MKNLRFLTICGATMLLVACTQDDVATTASYEAYKAAQPTPIAFSTYMGEQATTRTWTSGAITSDADLKDAGFGVFAYLTTNKYANTSNEQTSPQVVTPVDNGTTPNFMYNQVVSGTQWSYSPIKYWPNDFNGNGGAVDNRANGAATGSTTNYLSFFAYAPYTAAPADPSSVTNGIKGFSENTATTDPTVTYVINPAASDFVDLLWGVYNETNTSDYTTTENVLGTAQNGGYVMYDTDNNQIADKNGNAKVNINLTKQKTNGKVGFSFKHALAQISNITIDAIANVVRTDNVPGSGSSETIASATKITVKSVKIESTAALPTEGVLNLATGVWSLTNPANNATVWSKEFGGNGVILNSTIAEPAAPQQGDLAWGNIPSGVSVPTSSGSQSIANSFPLLVFFPDQQPTFKVTVEYVVRTEDTALAKKYSEVTQKISNTLQFGKAFEMNKKYTIGIHLGLTSIKFTATVDNWTSGGSAQPVDLPINVSSN